MKTHELKTWPDPFRAMWQGHKAFELRRNDRGFEPGDTLVLREWKPTGGSVTSFTGEYTGRVIVAEVSWFLSSVPEWGLAEGFCIMALERLHRYDDWSSVAARRAPGEEG